MIRKKTAEYRIVVFLLFLSLGIPMFYFIDGDIKIGGFGFMYQYLFGMGIVVVACTAFLIHPDIPYFLRLLQDCAALSIVYIILILWSCAIWSVRFERKETITKGLFENVYIILAILVAASVKYLFRKKAVLYCCYAMSIANILIIIPVLLKDPPEFLQELWELVATFGDATGGLMKAVEIHDLTFAFGIILLYALIKKDLYGRKQIIALSLIFSVTGLKRIAAAGIVLGFLLYHLMIRINNYKKYVYLLCSGIIVATFIYLVAVHAGLYDRLELAGLNTKGRNLIYGYINKLFYIGPGFIGNGLGFSSKAWNLPFYSKTVQDAYHNEYLRMYVEVGFCGYFAWLFLHLPFRIEYFIRKHGKEAGLLYLATAVYCYITYATDNTYYYYYLNFAVFLIVTGYKERKEKLCS